MKFHLLVVVSLFLGGFAVADENKLTEWRNRDQMNMLRWCVELNCQSEAATRYYFGSPNRKEEFKGMRGEHGPSELWIYELGSQRTIEVAMIRSTESKFTVWRTSYSIRSQDGKVHQENWHFHPFELRGEKPWRNMDGPPKAAGADFKPEES